MHYGEIKNCDIANGIGVRVTLFVSGCRNHCPHCFQEETWDFEYGRKFTDKTEQELFDMLEPSYIDGLTILGGEPFEPENQKPLLEFVSKMKKLMPDKTIWIYTGFTFEELCGGDSRASCGKVTEELIAGTDVLVDGRYIEEKKDISLRFKGSSNQRIIDVRKTLDKGQIVIWNE